MAEHDKTFKRATANKQSRAEVGLSCHFPRDTLRFGIGNELIINCRLPNPSTALSLLSQLPFSFSFYFIDEFTYWRAMAVLVCNLRSLPPPLCHLCLVEDSEPHVRTNHHRPHTNHPLKALLLLRACDRRQR